MKRFYPLVIAFFFLFLSGKIDAQVPVITISQVDTFAIAGMTNQTILKIKITTSDALQTLQKVGIKSLCDVVTDVDSVAIYQTVLNRFSIVNFPEDQVVWLTGSNKKITGDSVLFDNMTFPLALGDNYIWVVMNLNSKSVAGHFLDASILKNRIQISGLSYPASDVSPANAVQIRKKFFTENFEHINNSSDRFPLNWTQDQTNGNSFWTIRKGGYGTPDNDGNGNPQAAKSGKYNARIATPYKYTPRWSTTLISPTIDLSLAVKPMLTFYHAQMQWCKSICAPTEYDDTDSLGVYYKIGTAGAWKFLKHYNLPTPNGQWEKREIVLPDDALKSNVYLGFKGITQYGFGVCLDSLLIYEAGVLPREINSVVTDNPNHDFIPQGLTNVPVSRTNIRIKGNTNTINLNSFTATSANTSDNDVLPSGVKLWYTSDSLFVAPTLISTGQSFASGNVTFNSLNRKLETGDNYIWVTYDVSSTAIPGHTLNALIKTGNIVLDFPGTFPGTNEQPVNSLIIKQSVFFDDFETDKLWTLTGDFQRSTPMGLGGGVNSGSPDPTTATSGSKVLGNDLTGIGSLGNYENNITLATANTASTVLIGAKYFKNTELNFKRWLNVEVQDSAVIEYKYSGESTWRFLWKDNFAITDNAWQTFYKNTSTIFDRKDFTLRFRLGPTNVLNNYSGWNIDDLFITGDSIRYDAGITQYISPKSACSLTANEHIKVTVKNSGPKTLTNIPIKFSKDGGVTWVSETIPGSLAVDNTVDYTFTTPVDLSKPAIYNVIVKTAYPADDYKPNDSVAYKLTAVPTYSLPFTTDFEKDTTFWSAGGLNSSWKHTSPIGDYINEAASGDYCWKTDNFGYNNRYENSYVESPCFNLSSNDVPLVDVNFSYNTANKIDGAKFSYSLDEGATWNYVAKDAYAFPWYWYNDTIHAYHGIKGWTGQSQIANIQKWFNGIQVLPGATANMPKVKFRFEFKSDTTTAYTSDGFAFDDFKIYNAPYNVGVVSIDNLTATSCENTNPNNLKVTVKNMGIRDVRLNDSIIIAIKVNNLAAIVDTFKLAASLPVNTSRQFTMTRKVNLALAGNYTVKAYTLIEKKPLFYGTNNDSTTMNIVVNPNPIVNLRDSIYSGQKDTIVLHAPYQVNYGYLWTDKFSDVGNAVDYNVLQFGWQNLTVTNSTTLCFTKDSTYIKQLIPDVGVSKILSPLNDSCSFGNAFKPVIELQNFGTDTIKINHKIPVSIQLKGNAAISDTIVVPQRFVPGDKFVITLNKALDLSIPNNNTLSVATALPYDTHLLNDTAKSSFQVFGNPVINLGPDRHISTDTYTIDPGTNPDIVSYLWNTGATTPTLDISDVGLYSVKVKSTHGCYSSDTVNIWIKIHNLTISKIMNPLTTCDLPRDTAISCYLKNKGTDTIYVSEPIIMGYSINDSAFRNDVPFYVPSTLYPKDSILYTFNSKINLHIPAQYTIKVSSVIGGDNRPHDDTIVHHVEVYGYPAIELGPDKTVIATADTLRPGTGNYTYQWQDNSTDSVYIISKSHSEANHKYKVTATSIHGCASRDSVHVYLKVRDIGVTALRNLFDACLMPDSSIVRMKIKNMGTDTLFTTQHLTIAYAINGNTPVTEDITLPYNLLPDDTTRVSFFKRASFKSVGDYKILLSVSTASDLVPTNDTLTRTISVFGNPHIDIGANRNDHTFSDTIRTHASRPIASYKWQDGSTDSVYIITKNHYEHPAAGIWNRYRVTVTDTHNCMTADTAFILLVDEDLEITSIASPITSCTLSNQEQVAVKVTNVGNLQLSSRLINISYKINNGSMVSKSFVFTGDTTKSTIFVFPNLEDFSAINNYRIQTSLSFVGDVQHTNDTLSTVVKVTGNPTVYFDAINDSIKVNGYPYTLTPVVPPATYTYTWSTGESTPTANIMEDGGYSVTITDVNSCSAESAPVYLQKNVANLGVTGFLLPASSCKMTKDTMVTIRIANTGNLPISNAAVTVKYQINSLGQIFTRDVIFTGNPKDTLNYNFDEKADLSAAGSYIFTGTLVYASDAVVSDNSKDFGVLIRENPVITFKGLAEGTTEIPTLPFILDPGSGYTSYLWQDGTTTTQTFTATKKDTYTVSVVDVNTCKNTKTIVIDAITAVQSIDDDNSLQFYPNPAKDVVNYTIKTTGSENILMELITVDGKTVMQKTLEGEIQYKGTFNVDNLSKGIYYIRIIQNHKATVRKLIVE